MIEGLSDREIECMGDRYKRTERKIEKKRGEQRRRETEMGDRDRKGEKRRREKHKRRKESERE